MYGTVIHWGHISVGWVWRKLQGLWISCEQRWGLARIGLCASLDVESDEKFAF